MAKKPKVPYRVYLREGYYYADFRKLGGAREALKLDGEKQGVTDEETANKLAAERAGVLMSAEGKRQRVKGGIEEAPVDHGPGFKAFCVRYLVLKEKAKGKKERVSPRWHATIEGMLKTASAFFGDEKPIRDITTEDVEAFLESLSASRTARGGRDTISNGTLRHYLNTLSNVFKWAKKLKVIPSNPASDVADKPAPDAEEAHWLEPHEVALLLEAAATWTPPDEDRSIPFMHALLATFVLTGGRKAEVLGLQVDDISFERRKVTFRPSELRGLKTKNSTRTVPLWPQLETIIRAHLKDQAIAGGLLFPSPAFTPDPEKNQPARMLTDFHKALDLIVVRAGWKAGEVRSKAFRHSYTAARLQTLDRGAPVALYTVARELGHGGLSLVNKVYGHVSDTPHRAEVVEYKLESINAIDDPKKREQFSERLKALKPVVVAA